MKTRQNMGKIHGGLAEKGVTLSVHPPASSRQSDAAECGFHCSDGTFRLRAATLRGQNDHIEGRKRPLRGAKTATREAEAQQKGREAQWLRPEAMPHACPKARTSRRGAQAKAGIPASDSPAGTGTASGAPPCARTQAMHRHGSCPGPALLPHVISHHPPYITSPQIPM